MVTRLCGMGPGTWGVQSLSAISDFSLLLHLVSLDSKWCFSQGSLGHIASLLLSSSFGT